MAELRLENLCKSYGAQQVVQGIDLDVAEGEFIVLVGPSGCGKSTILRMIAGLEDITDGTLSIGGQVANDLGARDRNLAMVFQDYALYPNMTVAENIGFGLKMRGTPAVERERRVREVAELLQLTPYLDRKPKALSGGQRQRVAMGRALARPAQVFLFDEPLSNLDAKLRMDVRAQIKLLHQKLGMTTIFVTHDQTEAMTLADRIVCLDGGRIAQIGTPEELYNRPETVFVAAFIGSPQINLIETEALGRTLHLADGQSLTLPEAAPEFASPRRVLLGLRPEDLCDESRLPILSSPQKLAMHYLVPETLGSDTYLLGDLGGARVTARCAPGIRPIPGAKVALYADTARLHLFDPETRKRL
ncbi:MAG: sn-glycerol-3-phosphate ABC transporter ATP-binding protein UgpC [Tabrizicola sp.]|nr:sn-glycerol-3-phosphate ABC transporter ATP-binding protein UgpC [Tabrizicola sp.]